MLRAVHDLEPAAAAQQLRQLRDVRRAIARMRRARARPGGLADDVARARKQELRRARLVERAEQTAGVIEMQVAQHDGVDVLVADAARRERAQQHVLALEHAVTRAQLRLEERADARLEQHRPAVQILDEQAAARELEAVLAVGHEPLRPQIARHVAEHRAAVEALAIAFNRPEPHAAPPRLRPAPNCSSASRAYSGLAESSSACVPLATIRPRSMTTMRSAFCTVARRCAMTIVVRRAISFSSACCTSSSLAASSELVASSSSRIGGSLRIARAIAMRWRWPPESRMPRSPRNVS